MRNDEKMMGSALRIILFVFLFLALHLPMSFSDPASETEKLLNMEEKNFFILTSTGDSLMSEMDKTLLRCPEGKPLSLQDEESVMGWYFSFRNLRKAYFLTANKCQQIMKDTSLPKEIRNRALKISFGNLIEWYKMAAYFYSAPTKNSVFHKKFNEAMPDFNVPENEATTIEKIMADGKMKDRIYSAHAQLDKALDLNCDFDKKLNSQIDLDFEFINKKAPYLLTAKLEKWKDTAEEKLFGVFYPLNVAVSTWIGDTKYLPKEHTITYDRIQEMKSHLKPGDILFERENWFMSNIFLPGFWTHSIIYVGTAQDLEKMGLTENPWVAMHIKDFSQPDRHGHERRALEAVSEGVIMSSLEDACDADYIAALRPRLSDEQIKDAIIKAFAYVGRPYDFMFDFQTDDKLVCSELVYRSFRDKLSLNLIRKAGRWALPSLNILQKWANERNREDRELDFIFFVDSDMKTRKTRFATEQELIKSLTRPGFDVRLAMSK
ncbi:MAG: hypothetical protein HQM08_15305 [Candidatus Riflebacteria bacterium]|nr:hypothetical protein [Candidatus Riflebacteria bacterium]